MEGPNLKFFNGNTQIGAQGTAIFQSSEIHQKQFNGSDKMTTDEQQLPGGNEEARLGHGRPETLEWNYSRCFLGFRRALI